MVAGGHCRAKHRSAACSQRQAPLILTQGTKFKKSHKIFGSHLLELDLSTEP